MRENPMKSMNYGTMEILKYEWPGGALTPRTVAPEHWRFMMQDKSIPNKKLNPTGLCACGCGETTRLADRNRPEYGWVKGQHVLYVPGHRHRKPRPHGNSPVWSESCGCFLVPLTENRYAKVDARDVQTVSGIAWCVDGSGYVWASINGKGVRMHRLIMEPPDGFEVDHISGNRLDNRRANLRIASRAQNMRNKPANKSRDLPKGVSRSRNGYRARISLDGVEYDLGTFGTPEEAASAYDHAAIKMHGEFARTNGVQV